MKLTTQTRRLRGAATILLLALAFARYAGAAERPNILFVAIDDQNDWIGCLGGHPQVKTPRIDGLAARGTVFASAHCQAPLCNPSRTSLMTGLRPSTTGIYGLAPWFRQVEELKDLETLPQNLARHGYRTYSTGKIYHGGYGRQKTDSEFHVLGPPAGVGARPPAKLVKTPAPHPLVDWGVFPHRDEDKGDWRVASWAVEQLEKKPSEPFFLSVGFFLPHVPCYATQKWFDLYPEETTTLPPVRPDDRDDTPRFSWYLHWKLPEPRLKFLQEANEWKNLVRSYLACVSFVDSQVGRVLDALDESGLRNNTIVVLWSDHGWHLGEKLITGKNTVWERSTRVPLIFAGPGVARGAVCKKPAELLDIYPTLLELCGLPEKDSLEGHSLVPQLRNANAPREWPAITTHNHDNHGIRSEFWRYIRYADGSEELYDLRTDPNEWVNLASDPAKREILEEHRRWLPEKNAKPVPGSAHRILTWSDGQANWEGKDIAPGAPIPGVEPASEEFTPLFPADGVPAGWVVTSWSDLGKPPPEGATWRVQDGVLHGSTPRGTWLVSEREYGDFELEFEFKLGPRGNSGCALRAPMKGDPAFDGLELQMADLRYNPEAKPSELTGGFYRAVAPVEQVYRPEEWNAYRVRLEGSHAHVTLNGTVILDLDLGDYVDTVPRHDGSPAPSLAERPHRGHIGFQELSRGGDHVLIRNARLRELGE